MVHPFISVIIPVYNAESYLRQCVQSVLNQTYDSFEVILVDDGSKDASGALCDELAGKDARILVIHKENGGAADSRNRGVREARGAYIAFIDADDFVAAEYLSFLVELMNTYKTSIPVCDSFWTENREVDFAQGNSDKVIRMNAQEAALSVINEYGLKTLVPWGKLLPIEIVKQYPFPTGRKAEDAATLYKILYAAGGCVLSFCKLYGYYQNSAGLMHNLDEKYYRDVMKINRERWLFFKEQGEEEIATTMYGYYVCCMIGRRVNGDRTNTEALDGVLTMQFLRSGVRPLYMAEFLFYKLFKKDLLSIIDKIRK